MIVERRDRLGLLHRYCGIEIFSVEKEDPGCEGQQLRRAGIAIDLLYQDLFSLEIVPCPDRLLHVSAHHWRKRRLCRTQVGTLRARTGSGLPGGQQGGEEGQRQNIALSGTMANSRSISRCASSGFPSCR